MGLCSCGYGCSLLVVLMVPVSVAWRRVLGKSLGSLEEAATAFVAARGHERGFRIDTSHLPAEALPFTDAVKDLLGRLDDAAMRQEAFAADVAHELRKIGRASCRERVCRYG